MTLQEFRTFPSMPYKRSETNRNGKPINKKKTNSFTVITSYLKTYTFYLRRLFRFVTTDIEPSLDAYVKKRRLRIGNKEKLTTIIDILKARQKIKPPHMVASCYASRKPAFYLFNAFYLVWIISTMSLAIFSINFSFSQFRLQTTYIILLNLVSFKWVVNR